MHGPRNYFDNPAPIRFGWTYLVVFAAPFILTLVHILRWVVIFIVVAIIAGLLGFTGIAGDAAYIAKILFFIFLVLFLLSLVFGLVRRGPSV